MDHRVERLCYCVKCGSDHPIRCHLSTWHRRDKDGWQFICNHCRLRFQMVRRQTPLFDLIEEEEWRKNEEEYRK